MKEIGIAGIASSVITQGHMVVGSFMAFALLWQALHAGLGNSGIATMIALSCYTVLGLITYIYGTRQGKKGMRVYGSVLIALVVGRLLLIEVWDMALTARIITFFVIGALLMSTVFIKRKE